MIFKCKNCGGNVVYSPERKKMFCPFCESEDSEEREDGVIETSGEENGAAEGTTQAGAGQPVSRMAAAEGESQKKVTKVCPNCGGEISMTASTSATQCPYCDNYVIVDEQISGAYTPHMLIPFRMGKEGCKKLIRDKFEKCIFAPTDFLSEVRLNGIHGDYVPFWFYDYDTNCTFHGEGTKVRSWTTGNTQYTETSYYDVVRDMDINFDKIPVDASGKMPDDYMDSIEPYDYAELKPFSTAYLPGFMADKYDVSVEDSRERADTRCAGSLLSALERTVSGYTTCNETSRDIHLKRGKVHYALLPVWILNTRWEGKDFLFAMNGQTGKLVGNLPVSTKRVIGLFAAIAASLIAISVTALLLLAR